MTRDVLEAEARLSDGRTYWLVDTGGFDPEGKDSLPRAVRDRAIAAIRSADLVILVIDASVGVAPGDRETAAVARVAGVETIVAANKIDRRDAADGELEAWELGFSEVYGVSAEHGLGADDLLDAIAVRLPGPVPEGEDREERANIGELALAVVGRPNVGKSSLVNALLRQERAIVSEVPGTTRDSVDTVLRDGENLFRLVDTAGIRRKSRTEKGPEVLSVVQARKRIDECDVALLVLDAREGPLAQDAAVAGDVHGAGKGLILAVNKWDLAADAGQGAAEDFEAALDRRIPFARYAPRLRVSARTRRGVARILPTTLQVAENRRRRITTGELNRLLGRILRDQPPRTASGKRLRVYFVAQTSVAPPTITLVANRAEALHFSEERRVENLVREAADFAGTPIRISVRARSRKT